MTHSVELKSSPSLSVFPNPANSHATIDYIQHVTAGATIALYKVSGAFVKNIFTGVLNKNELYRFEIDKGVLGSGLYVIKAWNDENVQTVKLIFK